MKLPNRLSLIKNVKIANFHLKNKFPHYIFFRNAKEEKISLGWIKIEIFFQRMNVDSKIENVILFTVFEASLTFYRLTRYSTDDFSLSFCHFVVS